MRGGGKLKGSRLVRGRSKENIRRVRVPFFTLAEAALVLVRRHRRRRRGDHLLQLQHHRQSVNFAVTLFRPAPRAVVALAAAAADRPEIKVGAGRLLSPPERGEESAG